MKSDLAVELSAVGLVKIYTRIFMGSFAIVQTVPVADHTLALRRCLIDKGFANIGFRREQAHLIPTADEHVAIEIARQFGQIHIILANPGRC